MSVDVDSFSFVVVLWFLWFCLVVASETVDSKLFGSSVKRASKSRRSVAPARLLRCIAHRFRMPHKHNKETKKAKKKYERIRSTVDKLLQRLLLGVRVECSYCEIKEAVEHLKLIVADAPEEPEELDGGSLTKVNSSLVQRVRGPE